MPLGHLRIRRLGVQAPRARRQQTRQGSVGRRRTDSAHDCTIDSQASTPAPPWRASPGRWPRGPVSLHAPMSSTPPPWRPRPTSRRGGKPPKPGTRSHGLRGLAQPPQGPSQSIQRLRCGSLGKGTLEKGSSVAPARLKEGGVGLIPIPLPSSVVHDDILPVLASRTMRKRLRSVSFWPGFPTHMKRVILYGRTTSETPGSSMSRSRIGSSDYHVPILNPQRRFGWKVCRSPDVLNCPITHPGHVLPGLRSDPSSFAKRLE